MTRLKLDQHCPECGFIMVFIGDPMESESAYRCINDNLCGYKIHDTLSEAHMMTVDDAILYKNCYISACEAGGWAPEQETLDGIDRLIDTVMESQERQQQQAETISIRASDYLQDTPKPDKVRVQVVQDLRRSNAAQPIPSRKPARRGGKSNQRRKAIEEQ